MNAGWKKTIYWVFFIVLLLEFIFGYYLAAIYGFMSGDASSRVANAFYVLYSREPGLANIGFIWNPLPSFMEMIVLVLYPLFPSLASEGIAAVIVSSLFAALTAAMIVKAGMLYGLKRWQSVILALLYAFNPYIFYYGANGLTEAIFIYFISMAVLQLLLWARGDETKPLVLVAFALALGFWTRYETVFFGAAVALAVLAWIMRESQTPLKERYQKLEGLWVVVLTPVIFSGLLWIFFNYTIMGDGFYFLTSDYGNLGQAELLKSDAKFAALVNNPLATLAYVGERVWYFSIPLAIVFVIRLFERRVLKWDFLILVMLTASIPAMQALLLIRGGTAAWIRYYMYVFPIVIVWLPYEISKMKYRKTGMTALLAGLLASGWFMFGMMNNMNIASDEYEAFRHNKLYAEQQAARDVVDYVKENLPDRMILTDSFSSFTIIMGSGRPKNFIVTSDSDFKDSLDSPVDSIADYVLLPNPEVDVSPKYRLDTINQQYPGLYADGTEWATMEKEFGGFWKLYRIRKGESE
ncbi:glycosyltransferase family 39 protein [Paenibacillus sp. NPDC058071]|uniref:glycosyltransferase family 39 protein n=1 Tax=Paenibacillus sp. NPDC058071 TaxID=3346326 RepID=UPI0036DDEDA4